MNINIIEINEGFHDIFFEFEDYITINKKEKSKFTVKQPMIGLSYIEPALIIYNYKIDPRLQKICFEMTRVEIILDNLYKRTPNLKNKGKSWKTEIRKIDKKNKLVYQLFDYTMISKKIIEKDEDRNNYLTTYSFNHAILYVKKYLNYLSYCIKVIWENKFYLENKNILFNDIDENIVTEHKEHKDKNVSEIITIRDSNLFKAFLNKNDKLYKCNAIIIALRHGKNNIYWDTLGGISSASHSIYT
jgi:hypothetical protein